MTLREEIAELKNELEGYKLLPLQMKNLKWNGTMKERYCGVWIGDSQNLLLLEEEEKEEEDKEKEKEKDEVWGGKVRGNEANRTTFMSN
jgi:hypothetical protein